MLMRMEHRQLDKVAAVACVTVRPLEVMTNILIRSMGPVSEEDMVGDLVGLNE